MFVEEHDSTRLKNQRSEKKLGLTPFGWFGLMWLCLAANLVVPQAALAQITYSNTTDSAVSDTATPCANPLLRTFTVPQIYSVADVNIGVLMRHTNRGHVRLFLQSPQGTLITLIQNTGGTRDHINVLFDDSAAAVITTHTAANDVAAVATVVPPYQRTFRPLQALSAFNGQNANGIWTLRICDSVATGAGTFFHSTLLITPQPAVINVTKVSAIITDGVSGANFKALPGASVRYCIIIANAGPGIATAINANDNLPAILSYVPGTMVSGSDCATAATVEDDNATGPDETDPIGASFSGVSANITRATMTSGQSFALVLQATVN